MKYCRKNANKQGGITLMELMIVVAIISIVSAIAYPNYTRFVAKSKRASSVSVMLQVADRQQQFFMDNKRYATDMTSLGYEANPIMINDDGTVVAAGDSKRTYELSFQSASAMAYTILATPQLHQATSDYGCGALTMTEAGVKGQSGASDNCW